MIPLLILTNKLVGLNIEKSFLTFYGEMVSVSRYEIISSASITALYLIQYKMSKRIRIQKSNLEITVKERTKELETSNEELKITIQHLKETQMQLVQTEKMASLGVLTSGVAHEINNPLNFIIGGIGGLESYLGTTGSQTEQVQVLMSSIKTGADRVANIVSGLNQFNRSNDTFDENCAINDIIDNCLLMLQKQLKSRIEVKSIFFQ